MNNLYNLVINRTNSNSSEKFINLIREGAILLVVLEILGYRIPTFLSTSMNTFLLNIFYLLTDYKVPFLLVIVWICSIVISKVSTKHHYFENLHYNFLHQITKVYKFYWIIIFIICLLATNLQSIIDFRFLLTLTKNTNLITQFFPILFRNLFSLFLLIANIYWCLMYFCKTDNIISEKHPRESHLNSKEYINLAKREFTIKDKKIFLQIFVKNNELKPLDDIKEYFLIKKVTDLRLKRHHSKITIISQFPSYSDAKAFMNDYADEPKNFK
ncbi:hypothetical protein DY138_03835 [Apilactobacillus timberlakei]|uniref:hypothetical protein n=1 Tax=Apilactobacillus timberlakei TaxID=2008380 RepID=UPI00112AC355|nr:hypothetical protein [Apilactobacillus timberlakei]TPR18756.1 hypothetical protein DY138_03835 [Apilactobacillus timberlakei]TPR21079.1 hypothetical protein DY061_03300 [Apilactobacillus timberlakei]TPR23730.1 hypothetical protein DY083_01170 [Apilactobacillus timberlakei]TPR25080.1 hypothetical protein DY102_01245 [Apilactobacillus timberlakei]